VLPRFQHILVPLDFTAKNQAALDIAFELACQNKAAVTLLHVIETIENVPDEELRSFYKRITSRAEAELEVRGQRFAAAGIRVDRKILYGKRLTEIVRDARERKVDIVVMSSHKVDPAAAAQSLGTLSYQVSILCDCPVLLVK
jgi:nucleotide-binding universal stress UspA family protein